MNEIIYNINEQIKIRQDKQLFYAGYYAIIRKMEKGYFNLEILGITDGLNMPFIIWLHCLDVEKI